MANLNVWILSGYLIRDPETRNTTNGKTVTTFTFAVDDKFKKDAKPTFVKIQLWGREAETAAQYLKARSHCTVVGAFKMDEWVKDGVTKTQPVLDGSQLILGPKPPDRQEPQPQAQEGPSRGSYRENAPPLRDGDDPAPGADDDPDALPF